MSQNELSEIMDSGGSYPRTESTMITPEKLYERIEDIIHNAGIVGEEEDDLYPTRQQVGKHEIDQLLKRVDYEDESITEKGIMQKGAEMAETAMELSYREDEETKYLFISDNSKEEGFSRDDFTRIKREVSEAEEESLESI